MNYRFYILLCLASTGTFYTAQESDDGVHLFNKQRDSDEVKRIAADNIDALVSRDYPSQKRDKNMVAQGIASCINSPTRDPRYTTKVYLVKNKPVGFVTYSLELPFYSPIAELVGYECLPNGHICHFAIDEKERNKGYGFKLFDDCLQDLKKRNAKRANLITLGWDQRYFENKFGFTAFKGSKFTYAERQMLWLQPIWANPARMALKLLRNLK
jgi:GNAT superfamily N-acetyltransferase